MAGGILGGHRRAEDEPAGEPDVDGYSAQAVHDISDGQSGVNQNPRGVLPPILPRFQPAPPPPGSGGEVEPAAPAAQPEPQIWASLPEGLPTRPGIRTPRRAAVRTHLLAGGVVAVLVAFGLGAFWFAELHVRISEASLEHGIAAQTGAPTVHCIPAKGNGSVWTCGVIYGAESVCDIANVSVFGSWSTVGAAAKRCVAEPSLTRLAPKVDEAGLTSALRHDYGVTETACAHVFGSQNRWFCVARISSGGFACTQVRAVAWMPFTRTDESLSTCNSVPALRKIMS
jgi:hypothetical protein